MNYLHRKKLAFMSIVNQVKGFVRTISGVPPITLESCVDDKSVINYQIYGNSVQDGEPTPDVPVEIVSVGERTSNLYGGQKDYTLSTTINDTHKSFYNAFKIGKTYTILGFIDNTQGTSNAQFRMSVGKTVDGADTWNYCISNSIKAGERGYSRTTFTIPETYNGKLNMQYQVNGGTVTFMDMMLVEGNYTLNKLPSYEPYGYKIPVETISTKNKNLFNPDKITENTAIFADGTLTPYENFLASDFISVNSNTSYVISLMNTQTTTLSGWNLRIHVYDKNKNWISNIAYKTITTYTKYEIPFITPDNCCFVRFSYFYGASEIQLELGNLVTEYEPYEKNITTNIYLNEPLRAIGKYKDYVDFESGKLVRNVFEETITTVDGISSVVVEGRNRVLLSNISHKPYTTNTVGNQKGEAISNKFVKHTDTYNKLYGYSNAIMSYITNAGGNRVAYTFDATITTKEQAQEAIGEGFDVIYVLETPIEETIDLSNLPTCKGTTIYTIGTTVQPTNMEVTYYSTVKE